MRALGLVSVSLAALALLVGVVRAQPSHRRDFQSPSSLIPIEQVRAQHWTLLPVEAHGHRYRPLAFDGHVHTSYSHDASHPARDVIALAERIDLDLVVITDHGSSSARATIDAWRGDVIPLLGEEVGGAYGHSVIWNVLRRRDTAELVHDMDTLGPFVHGQHGVVVLAHPGWWIHGQTYDPRRWMQYDTLRRGGIGEEIDALELWNGTYPAESGALIDEWSQLLARGLYVPIVGNSDFHRAGEQYLGNPRNVILCEEDAQGALVQAPVDCLVDAVCAGRSYVTSGPSIALTVGGMLPGEIVRTRPHTLVPLHARVLAPEGGTLTIFVGTSVAARFALPVGQEVEHALAIAAPSHDGFVRAQIDLLEPHFGHEPFSLVTNPVRIDVGPPAEWRGPDEGRVPPPPGFRVERHWGPRPPSTENDTP